MLRFLQRSGYSDLHAVDATRYTLRRLAELGIDAREGLLPDIPYADNRFDLVIASQILEHIPRRQMFLRSIRRVLKPSGRAAIIVPDNCLSPLDEPSHVAVSDHRRLARTLRRHFEIEHLDTMKDSNHEIPILFAVVRTRSSER
jgi:ubiquinone/menaquinone biosynthesis C-methylase UbiE